WKSPPVPDFKSRYVSLRAIRRPSGGSGSSASTTSSIFAVIVEGGGSQEKFWSWSKRWRSPREGAVPWGPSEGARRSARWSAARAVEAHAVKGQEPAAEHAHPVAVLIHPLALRFYALAAAVRGQASSASSSPMLAATMSTS